VGLATRLLRNANVMSQQLSMNLIMNDKNIAQLGLISTRFVRQSKSCWHIALGKKLAFRFNNIFFCHFKSVTNCAEFHRICAKKELERIF